MPPSSWTSSPTYQLLFLTIFILAFFPGAFRSLLNLPLRPFFFLTSSSSSPPRTNVTAPSCCCCCGSHPSPSPVCLPSHNNNNNPNPHPHPAAATAAAGKMSPSPSSSSWFQKTFTLPARSRGCYLVTTEVVAALPEIATYRVGLVNLFVQHTSCALSVNENWDEEVRADMADALDRIAPEEAVSYRHSAEGKDDMPAHIKSSLVGSSVTVPITDGQLATGTWQGIWYLEFRARPHTRTVVATIQGEREGGPSG